MNHRPDAHSLVRRGLPNLTNNRHRKYRRCGRDVVSLMKNSIGMRGWDELVQGVRPKSFFGPADLLVCYDCCQCSRDTTAWCVKRSWWSHDWPEMVEMVSLCGLQFLRYGNAHLDSRAHPFHFSVRGGFSEWTLGTEKPGGETPKSFEKRLQLSAEIILGWSWCFPTLDLLTMWPNPDGLALRGHCKPLRASGHAMDVDGGGCRPWVRDRIWSGWKKTPKVVKSWVVLGDLQISKEGDEKKHILYHIFLQVDGARILEVTSVMLKWSMILIWWDDIIEICCCRCFILYRLSVDLLPRLTPLEVTSFRVFPHTHLHFKLVKYDMSYS